MDINTMIETNRIVAAASLTNRAVLNRRSEHPRSMRWNRED